MKFIQPLAFWWSVLSPEVNGSLSVKMILNALPKHLKEVFVPNFKYPFFKYLGMSIWWRPDRYTVPVPLNSIPLHIFVVSFFFLDTLKYKWWFNGQNYHWCISIKYWNFQIWFFVFFFTIWSEMCQAVCLLQVQLFGKMVIHSCLKKGIGFCNSKKDMYFFPPSK